MNQKPYTSVLTWLNYATLPWIKSLIIRVTLNRFQGHELDQSLAVLRLKLVHTHTVTQQKQTQKWHTHTHTHKQEPEKKIFFDKHVFIIIIVTFVFYSFSQLVTMCDLCEKGKNVGSKYYANLLILRYSLGGNFLFGAFGKNTHTHNNQTHTHTRTYASRTHTPRALYHGSTGVVVFVCVLFAKTLCIVGLSFFDPRVFVCVSESGEHYKSHTHIALLLLYWCVCVSAPSLATTTTTTTMSFFDEVETHVANTKLLNAVRRKGIYMYVCVIIVIFYNLVFIIIVVIIFIYLISQTTSLKIPYQS